MKRLELERYLGKSVRIKLFNGRIEEGYLHKTGEEKYKYNPNLYFPKNSYFTVDSESSITCNSCIFKCSHVVGVNEVKQEEREYGKINKMPLLRKRQWII